jgi:phage internal scaffolding protein
MFLRSPYNYDSDEASQDTGLVCPEESLTKQSFKEQSDINVIVNKFMKTGVMPETVNMPRYGDFTEATDYQTALNLVMQAEDAFMELPATLRARFENDPGQLLAFIEDDSNRAEAEALGLVQAQVIEPAAEPTEGT